MSVRVNVNPQTGTVNMGRDQWHVFTIVFNNYMNTNHMDRRL